MARTRSDGAHSPDPDERPEGPSANRDLEELGSRMRSLRLRRGTKLKELAEQTGLSISMISAVERGRANPSIGTLISIADALRLSIVNLFGMPEGAEQSPVTRIEEQPVVRTKEGFDRRLLIQDRTRGIEMVLNEYAPGVASNSTPTHHSGFELGVVLEGELDVSVNGRVYHLREGDAVSYRSTYPHRSVNVSRAKARTIWVNLFKES